MEIDIYVVLARRSPRNHFAPRAAAEPHIGVVPTVSHDQRTRRGVRSTAFIGTREARLTRAGMMPADTHSGVRNLQPRDCVKAAKVMAFMDNRVLSDGALHCAYQPLLALCRGGVRG